MISTARFLLFVLLVVIGVKASEQAYRWLAYADERARIVELRDELGVVAERLVAARASSDSLAALIRADDEVLDEERRGLQRYTRMARHRRLAAHLWEDYQAELTRHNLHVVERNALARELEGVQGRIDDAAGRYNMLADSIHVLAVRIGKPYYQVPTALEAAMERRGP